MGKVYKRKPFVDPITKVHLDTIRYGFHINYQRLQALFPKTWVVAPADIVLVYQLQYIDTAGNTYTITETNLLRTNIITLLRLGRRLLYYKAEIKRRHLEAQYGTTLKILDGRIFRAIAYPRGTIHGTLPISVYRQMAMI